MVQTHKTKMLTGIKWHVATLTSMEVGSGTLLATTPLGLHWGARLATRGGSSHRRQAAAGATRTKTNGEAGTQVVNARAANREVIAAAVLAF